MRKRRAKVPVTTLFPSCTDRGYIAAEREFIDANVFFPLYEQEIERWKEVQRDTKIPDLFKESPANYYRQLIMNCWERSPSGEVRYNDNVGQVVVAVAKTYGMDAIRMDGGTKLLLTVKPSVRKKIERYLHPLARKRDKARRIELGNMDALGSLVCAAIRQWQREALSGDLTQRRNAVKWLKSTFAALVPTLIGKRGNRLVGSKHDVMEYYYKELFRLRHVEKALRSSSGPRNFSLKVKAASENYALPVNTIRWFWDLDDDDKPRSENKKRNPVTLMARTLTAQHFKITEHAVKNLLLL